MADITFPAHITVRRETDVDGLPILAAQTTVSEDTARLPLPPGPDGEPGPKGRPRTTFRKMGQIANVAARPGGLGAEDRGKWWHRLDDNGMDVWTGTGWQHSPDAVGPQGEIADPNKITVTETKHREDLTVPILEFSGADADQQLEATAAAGLRGPKGPVGSSGKIADAKDYDKSVGATQGSLFAFNRATQMFRPVAAPLGAGPWSWYQEDFVAETVGNYDRIEAGNFTIPALPFDWRPLVYGHFWLSSVGGGQSVEMTARLHHSEGELVATTQGMSGEYFYLAMYPCFRYGRNTRTMSPATKYGIAPAGRPTNLVISAERNDGSGNIAFRNTRASLVVFALPT